MGKWKKIDTSLNIFNYSFDEIFVDIDKVWGVNYFTKQLFQTSDPVTNEWSFTSNNIRHISVTGSVALYGLTYDRERALACVRPCSGEWIRTFEVPGIKNMNYIADIKLKQIEADKTHVFFLSKAGDVFVLRVFSGYFTESWEDNMDHDLDIIDITPTVFLKPNNTYVKLKVSAIYLSTFGRYILFQIDDHALLCERPCLNSKLQKLSLPESLKQAVILKNQLFILTKSRTLYLADISDEVEFEKVQNELFLFAALSTEQDKIKLFDSFTASEQKYINDILSNVHEKQLAWKLILTRKLPKIKFLAHSNVAKDIPENFDAYVVSKSSLHCDLNNKRFQSFHKIYSEYQIQEHYRNYCHSLGVDCKWNDKLKLCERTLDLPITKEINFRDESCVHIYKNSSQNGLDVSLSYGFSTEVEISANLLLTKLLHDQTCKEYRVRENVQGHDHICTDNSNDVNALDSCLNDRTKRKRRNCFNIAFRSTSLLYKCKSQVEYCGTFFELHVKDDLRVISRTKILIKHGSTFRSGYFMAEMSAVFTSYPQIPQYNLNYSMFHTTNMTPIICRGEYELWWVQYFGIHRKRILKFKKTFSVSKPLCDWDDTTQTYLPFTLV